MLLLIKKPIIVSVCFMNIQLFVETLTLMLERTVCVN